MEYLLTKIEKVRARARVTEKWRTEWAEKINDIHASKRKICTYMLRHGRRVRVTFSSHGQPLGTKLA